jgi:serine protease
MNIKLYPEVFIRDDINDNGNEPSQGSSRSPDIIVRSTPVNNSSESFGHYSGTLGDYNLSDNVEFGNRNFIYVRAFNKSPMITYGSSVDLYWSHPSTLILPKQWNFIGTAQLPVLPPYGISMVSSALPWDYVPNKGHYCFIGVIHNFYDPPPDLSTINNLGNFRKFVQENNNVVWRNFNVVDAIPNVSNEYCSYPFLVRRSYYDLKEDTDLEVCTDLPEGSQLWLILSGIKYGLEQIGCRRFYNVNSSEDEIEATINYIIPKTAPPGVYSIYARQLFDDQEVGRVTWSIQVE